MMSFKRLPVTLLPILLLAVIVAMFIFYVPAGGDLISRWGDIVLGGLLVGLFAACVRSDLQRFREGMVGSHPIEENLPLTGRNMMRLRINLAMRRSRQAATAPTFLLVASPFSG